VKWHSREESVVLEQTAVCLMSEGLFVVICRPLVSQSVVADQRAQNQKYILKDVSPVWPSES